MTRQSSDYPLDYTKGSAEVVKEERLREMTDKASEQIKGAADSAQEIASKVSEQAREYGAKAQGIAKEFKPFVEKSLKDQPMATLATAAIIAFVLGALWKK